MLFIFLKIHECHLETSDLTLVDYEFSFDFYNIWLKILLNSKILMMKLKVINNNTYSIKILE